MVRDQHTPSEEDESGGVGDPASWDTRSLWRTTATTVLLPNLFYGTGQGAIIPIIPLFATQLGASIATAALAAAMVWVGQLIAAAPAGWLVGRIGEKSAMYSGATAAGCGAVACMLAVNITMLIAGVLFIGIAAAVFTMARHSFVTVAVPISHRGRGLSLLAGSNRLGVLIGPFGSAAVIHVTGDVRPAFGIVIATSLCIAVVLWLAARGDAIDTFAQFDSASDDPDAPGIWATFVVRWKVLLKVGLTAGLISTMRISRQVIVPLTGVVLGLPATTIALVVGVGAACDFALFYVGGQIMDRFGRLWTAIPSMLVFGLCHGLLAVVADLPQPFVWYLGASTLMSLGNGLTSGVVATMGSDLADQRAPAAFLGSWRVITEIGPSSAPFAISGLTAMFSLSVACFAMGGTALLGTVLLWWYIPRYLPKLPRL